MNKKMFFKTLTLTSLMLPFSVISCAKTESKLSENVRVDIANINANNKVNILPSSIGITDIKVKSISDYFTNLVIDQVELNDIKGVVRVYVSATNKNSQTDTAIIEFSGFAKSDFDVDTILDKLTFGLKGYTGEDNQYLKYTNPSDFQLTDVIVDYNQSKFSEDEYIRFNLEVQSYKADDSTRQASVFFDVKDNKTGFKYSNFVYKILFPSYSGGENE
ncbi:lipoprotein 17-related variable surface protein [Mycoplasma simbae]|uniref:lipoprotein 17-related variable surface protein n=1 Tax=Mycoplasma simbae TaxID=36744 RepID=UPI000495991E|nr:lipoprotein 17-related variable surface protein [Mycoplasma simbae]